MSGRRRSMSVQRLPVAHSARNDAAESRQKRRVPASSPAVPPVRHAAHAPARPIGRYANGADELCERSARGTQHQPDEVAGTDTPTTMSEYATRGGRGSGLAMVQLGRRRGHTTAFAPPAHPRYRRHAVTGMTPPTFSPESRLPAAGSSARGDRRASSRGPRPRSAAARRWSSAGSAGGSRGSPWSAPRARCPGCARARRP